MTLKVRKEEDIRPIYMAPGDSIQVTYNDEKLVEDTVERNIEIDRAVIFDVKNELGLKDGIGGAVGKKQEDKKKEKRG